MAASGGSPGPLADTVERRESGDQGPFPNKRMKIEAAVTELVGGSSTDTEEEKQQRKTAAAAVGEGFSVLPATPTVNTPPLPLRCLPFPKSGNMEDVSAWNIECRRISKLAEKDPRQKLPTVMKPKDSETANCVVSSRDKALVRDAARSIVSVCPIAPDGNVIRQCTGIVVGWNETKNCARILTTFKTIRGLDPRPKGGTGGPVIDHDGNVTGMSFRDASPHPTVLAISTILTCIEMWMKFSRIACPIHGLRLRTVELLQVSAQEEISLAHNINSGYVVDEVLVDSIAERHGIRCGDVIVSFDGLRVHTLSQLEDYILSLGWGFLQRNIDSSSMVDLKLEVYDPLKCTTRSIILPAEFCDASEREEIT